MLRNADIGQARASGNALETFSTIMPALLLLHPAQMLGPRYTPTPTTYTIANNERAMRTRLS
jgi:hypothetical protein